MFASVSSRIVLTVLWIGGWHDITAFVLVADVCRRRESDILATPHRDQEAIFGHVWTTTVRPNSLDGEMTR